LIADGIEVKGFIDLRDGYEAEGEVRLVGAQIGGNLECRKARFSGLLNAEAAVIGGVFYWTNIADPASAKLDLANASVGALADDLESWPAPGNLCTFGFVYQHISSGPGDAQSRLNWLARLQSFTPQPYRQLAKVLQDAGDDVGARRVLFNMERRRRRDRGVVGRIWSHILRMTIGYGYYPGRSLICLIFLTVLGCLLFSCGYAAGGISPTDKDAYDFFKHNSQIPPEYDAFNPFIYSLESSFPLVTLGQASRWQPDPNPNLRPPPSHSAVGIDRLIRFVTSARSLRVFHWLQICFGWFFTTMGVAAITGIVRTL
jgi:hypothetical protein